MADLEQRVKRLEGELRILKNQVQMTLLDIQAELAAHYYPELRTETEARVSTPRAVAGKTMGSRAKPQTVSPTLYEDDSAQEPDEPEPIHMKKVSLDQIHLQEKPHAGLLDDVDELEIVDQLIAVACPDSENDEPKQPQGSPSAESIANPVIQSSVIHWIGDTVTVLGKEQTRRIVELCVQDGRIDAETAKKLEGLLDLGATCEPEEAPSFDAVLNAMVELVEILETH